MKYALQQGEKWISAISCLLLRVAGLLCLILVLLTTEQVLARYLAGDSSIAMQELEWHLFGVIFLLGAAGTLAKDEHVRVDLLYGKFPPRLRYCIDIGGSVLFLLPMAWVLTAYGIEYMLQARSYGGADTHTGILGFLLAGEGSPNPGGLPGRWMIKGMIPLCGLLLLLQGTALILKRVGQIIYGEAPQP